MTARPITEIVLTFDGAPVAISWQRGDDYRAERLFRVIHFLALNNALPPQLIRLHDHAGILRPCYRSMPTDARAIRLTLHAWRNEGEQDVWHILGDDPRAPPFLEDHDGTAIKPSPAYLRPPAPASVG